MFESSAISNDKIDHLYFTNNGSTKNNQTNKIKYLTNLTRNWTLVTNKMKSRVGYSGTPLLAAAYHSIQTRVLPSSTAN